MNRCYDVLNSKLLETGCPVQWRVELDHLGKLNDRRGYIGRETFSELKELCSMWPISSDSTLMLWPVRKNFFWTCAISNHKHDGYCKVHEMIEFKDRVDQGWS